jgi:hypothetical protein
MCASSADGLWDQIVRDGAASSTTPPGPHSALGDLTPTDYAKVWTTNNRGPVS